MQKTFLTGLLIIMSIKAIMAQTQLGFDGQLSAYGNYSPDNELDYFFGGRYLPDLSLKIPLKNTQLIDFELGANIYGSMSFSTFDSIATYGDIDPYRLWARYTGKQFEVRVGLQKIDFGSAMLLRPLQWFDEIDPRDPLKFTNGIYGVLGRYYFLNNANIWLWVLYGNENPRGFELMKTYDKTPEFGGRMQYPVPKGEIALSYHHRTADSQDLPPLPAHKEIPENRIGLDGKWDVAIGAWFEAAYVHKSKDVGILTNETFLTLGTDYTFRLGNGLNVVLEHLVNTIDQYPFAFTKNKNTTASTLSYPLGLFGNISTILYYSWETGSFSFFLNYEYQFKHITGYIMPYYNPASEQSNIVANDFENTFSGPGLRLMVVFNH